MSTRSRAESRTRSARARSLLMTTIDSVFAREILDSRGNPTVEVEVALEGGRGPRRRALRRVHRRARGGRAARRRQEALPRQGRAEGGGGRERRRSRPSCSGEDAPTRRSSTSDDRARRHRQQGEAGRQRHPGRLPGRGEGGGGGARPAALPLRRRRQRAHAARAVHEHRQRRRPRGQHGRPPGVHDRARRRAQLRARRCAWGSRSSTR